MDFLRQILITFGWDSCLFESIPDLCDESQESSCYQQGIPRLLRSKIITNEPEGVVKLRIERGV